MPDKYGVGLKGVTQSLVRQYTGVQRPKKKKKKPSDPMFIEFDTYDAQDGLMDEHRKFQRHCQDGIASWYSPCSEHVTARTV